MIYDNPQKAYKAGYALIDPSAEGVGSKVYRHVLPSGRGTIYTVPDGALEPEALVNSAYGDIYGALLDDVERMATEKRTLQ